MLIGAGGFGQLFGLVIHIVMPLRRAIDAIGPVQAGVEPLRAVGCGALGGQHETHFVEIGAGIFLGGEITTLPAPIGPGPRQTVEHLLGRSFARLFGLVRGRHRAPQELGHALFGHLLQFDRNAGLAEILLRYDVRGHLRPAGRHFDLVQTENDRAIGVADLGCSLDEIELRICVLPGFREFSLDFHDLPHLIALNFRSRVIARHRRTET